MQDDMKQQILDAIKEERKEHWERTTTAIKPFINLGLVVIIFGVIVMFQIDERISAGLFSPGISVVLIILVGIIIIFGAISWDIIAGINIIEQKLKLIENRKE